MISNYVAIQNIEPILQAKLLPTITMWNRLEPRPRTDNFDRALKAEVRDALWMLTKQWQMGEFRGDDAGSPVFSKIHVETTQLTKYKANKNAVQSFDSTVPLEAKVEQRMIPFESGDQIIALDLRLLMGRHWLKMVASIGNFKNDYLTQFPISAPNPTKKEDAQICAHKEVWQKFTAVAGRAMDGYKFYVAILASIDNAIKDITVPAVDEQKVKDLATKFIEWYEALYLQPIDPQNNAWKPDQLEYQFATSAPTPQGEKVMEAEEYYHGHLDWYNLDINPKAKTLGDTGENPAVQDAITRTFIPVPLSFDGMPNTRWWTFEDSRTNFGDINPDTTDLNKLLLIEFGLVYANDWFLFPLTLPAGSIAKVKGMSVTNVFGERIWVDAAGSGEDDDWQRWSMFNLSIKGDSGENADNSIVILPSTEKLIEGKPLEEIHMIRDEVANMVFGIETSVPLASGTSKPGAEAAIELKNYLQKLINDQVENGTIVPVEIDYKADIRYQLMNSAPDNMIPFIPVHVEGSNREIQLQRASLPRILLNNNQPAEKIKPRTNLLREGLNEGKIYLIAEEAVPQASIKLTQSFQRSRWYNGKVVTWLGVRKQTGRGDASSGLAYDEIIPVRKK